MATRIIIGSLLGNSTTILKIELVLILWLLSRKSAAFSKPYWLNLMIKVRIYRFSKKT